MSVALLNILGFTPIILALIASSIVWRMVHRPILFLVISTFALLGIQSIISPMAVNIFIFSAENSSTAAAQEAFTRSLIAASVCVVFLGSGLLWWLFQAMHRTK